MYDDETRHMTADEMARDRCPIAYDLRSRALVVVGMLDDETRKKELAGLIFSLGHIIRSGTDIDVTRIWGPYHSEVLEMLARAEQQIA